MATPTRSEIEQRARELYAENEFKRGDAVLAESNPEVSELQEDGFWNQAISELMHTSKPRDYEAQWREYNGQTENLDVESERVHSDFTLAEIIRDIKEHLGIVLVAEAGHGKSYTAFSLAKEAMKDRNTTVIILSPSTIWSRQYGKIGCVKVGTESFNPIVPMSYTGVESVGFLRDAVHVNLDKKWRYVRDKWLEELLLSKQSLLFEIKYRNGRRIKAFESVMLQYLYEMQEQLIERIPEWNHHYIVIFEEIQNSFGTYSMNSDDSLDLLTLFTQSRSDANIHYIGVGQRLNDISTKVIERLRPMVGLTLGENSLRKIKSQLPENLKDRVQELPKRHWLYLDGKTNPEIEIPEYRKDGYAVLLNRDMDKDLTETEKRLSLLDRLRRLLNRKQRIERTETIMTLETRYGDAELKPFNMRDKLSWIPIQAESPASRRTQLNHIAENNVLCFAVSI
jgi:hypothetical protein